VSRRKKGKLAKRTKREGGKRAKSVKKKRRIKGDRVYKVNKEQIAVAP